MILMFSENFLCRSIRERVRLADCTIYEAWCKNFIQFAKNTEKRNISHGSGSVCMELDMRAFRYKSKFGRSFRCSHNENRLYMSIRWNDKSRYFICEKNQDRMQIPLYISRMYEIIHHTHFVWFLWWESAQYI